MFNITPRDRYLYAGPVGREVAAMSYGRLAYRPDPPKLTAHRHAVPVFSRATTAVPERVPFVRAHAPKPSKPARYSDTIAAMLRSRALSEPKERQ